MPRPLRVLLTVGLAAGLLLALAAPAPAAVLIAHGRAESDIFQFGSPAWGIAHNAIQAEELTSGVPNDSILRGADRQTKVFQVLRVQVDSVALQAFDAGVWVTVIANTVPVNSGTASSALSKTPFIATCDNQPRDQFYRVQAQLSQRWANTGRLTRVVRFSHVFQHLRNAVTGCT
jgi:hypothetical protein